MTPEELNAFLERRPPLCCVVSTLRADGSPHAVPVWYAWDGERARIWSDELRAWVKNAVRDPRVALTVHIDEEPYSAVSIRGRADVHFAPLSEVVTEVRSIAGRYVPDDEIDSTIGLYEQGQQHAIVTITPTSINAWTEPS